MKATPDMVFPVPPGLTVARIELKGNDTGYVIYECGVLSGQCITDYGPFETYREAIGHLQRFPQIKLDPYLKWKREHPRHAYALEHLEKFEDSVKLLFSGFEFTDEFVEELWGVSNCYLKT